MAEAPGRTCPVSYRYGAAALAAPATLVAETLWIAGGLYGNPEALQSLLELYEAEPGEKRLVFNGDFHWFDVAAEDFERIQRAVLMHEATLGNIEAELARPEPGAGCGCAYPDWVGDEVVARSNGIMERLRAAAAAVPGALPPLDRLPRFLVAEVGASRVAIVHGDAGSLAGWGFSQERLATRQGLAEARAAFDAARADVFASSHTCLPVLQRFEGDRALVNNGSAGMPNFAGTRYGLATRISVRPRPGACYGARAGTLHLEAVAIPYDHARWARRFLASWPAGSDAHASYWTRILEGPRYEPGAALRARPSETALAA